MKWLLKIGFDIFGNKASMGFALLVLVPALFTAVWKYNAWLDSRDEALLTQVKLEQSEATSKVLEGALKSRIAANEADEQTMLNLQLQKDAVSAVANQAKKELSRYMQNEKETECGKWSTATIPTFPKRVLLEYLRETRDPSRLYEGCTGTPSICATKRLSDALDGTIDHPIRVPGSTNP